MAWLILGQKNAFLNLKLCHSISNPPYGLGTWNFDTMCVCLRSSTFLVVPIIFWSTFFFENFITKNIRGHSLKSIKYILSYSKIDKKKWFPSPLCNLLLKLGLDLRTQCTSALCYLVSENFGHAWLTLGLKTMFFALKLCQALSQPPNRVGTTSLEIIYI